MKDENKTKAQLIEELARLRERIENIDKSHEHLSTDTHEEMSRFEAAIENTPMVAVQGYDKEGVIYHWNKASGRMYGYGADGAIGKRIQDLIIADEDVGAFERTVREIIETGEPTACNIWKPKTRDGDSVWTHSSMFPVKENGRIAEIFCMDVDITHAKKMEESLREQEEHLRTMRND